MNARLGRMSAPLVPLLATALAARESILSARRSGAVRLFNGFLEGEPNLVAETYAETLVLRNLADPPEAGLAACEEAKSFYLATLPWLRSVWLKTRHARIDESNGSRRGQLVHAEAVAKEIREGDVRYALDLGLNQDTSFYPDTRNLRLWAATRLSGKRVLNTFAHTGSLGVAAMAGGASEVLHVDRGRQFLELAKQSHQLNGHAVSPANFWLGDFFAAVAAFKRRRALFDCVFLDPPFFSTTAKGTVNLVSESARLINKVRPLVADGGWLVAVNNALFLSGADYLRELEALCADGYLAIEELVPVPADCIGFPDTIRSSFPVDPAPFNHATKIAILRVRRKPEAAGN
jgi:23S rRNA (cytosine1962-C5)-methyltransferase